MATESMTIPWRRLLPKVTQIACVAAGLLALAACGPASAPETATDQQSLAGLWAFQPGDNPAWAAPDFDDRDWPRLRVPGSWRRQGFADLDGMAWYRRRVQPADGPDDILAVTLGKIDSAYEVFAGGRRLGGMGALPPNARMEYDRHGTYVVPPSARAPDGSVVLAIRVWRSPGTSSSAGGPVEGPFEIGPFRRLIDRNTLAEARQLGLVMLFLLVAIYHASLRIRLKSGPDYAWFAVLALLAAGYGFLRTQLKYAVFDDFGALKKLEHVELWLLPPTTLQFFWTFFREPPPRWLRAAQAALVAGAVAVAVSPGLELALLLLPWLQLAVMPMLVMAIVLVIRRIAAGDREARVVGLAITLFGATIAHDSLVDQNILLNPRLGLYGFTVLVVGMSITLGNRFQRALRERDTLMRELEARVDMRTQALNEAYLEMEKRALRDSLTQVMNRRAVRERGTSELARARRHGSAFAVAMVDIDLFKAVNDTCGHATGDQVLIEVARRLTASVRASDDVGRWGGEEFLVLMPGADRAEAAAAGERLRAAVADTPFTMAGDAGGKVTISIGITAVNAAGVPSCELDALVQQADDALYQAKAAGRNAVRVFAAS
jgi:diguanylate cyclase (GGDEF)-like protein